MTRQLVCQSFDEPSDYKLRSRHKEVLLALGDPHFSSVDIEEVDRIYVELFFIVCIFRLN